MQQCSGREKKQKKKRKKKIRSVNLYHGNLNTKEGKFKTNSLHLDSLNRLFHGDSGLNVYRGRGKKKIEKEKRERISQTNEILKKDKRKLKAGQKKERITNRTNLEQKK